MATRIFSRIFKFSSIIQLVCGLLMSLIIIYSAISGDIKYIKDPLNKVVCGKYNETIYLVDNDLYNSSCTNIMAHCFTNIQGFDAINFTNTWYPVSPTSTALFLEIYYPLVLGVSMFVVTFGLYIMQISIHGRIIIREEYNVDIVQGYSLKFYLLSFLRLITISTLTSCFYGNGYNVQNGCFHANNGFSATNFERAAFFLEHGLSASLYLGVIVIVLIIMCCRGYKSHITYSGYDYQLRQQVNEYNQLVDTYNDLVREEQMERVNECAMSKLGPHVFMGIFYVFGIQLLLAFFFIDWSVINNSFFTFLAIPYAVTCFDFHIGLILRAIFKNRNPNA